MIQTVIVTILVRSVGVLIKVECWGPHLLSMEKKKFKCKIDTLQLYRSFFKLFDFKVRNKFKIKCASMKIISRLVTF